MHKQIIIRLVLLQLASLFDGCGAVELDVGMSGLNGAGFFMKPFFPWHNDTSVQEWPLVALPGLQYVTATYGPFAAQADAMNSGFSTLSSQSAQVVDGFIVSAHLVSNRVSTLRPQVRIVFHANRQLLYGESGRPGSAHYRSKADSLKNQQLCMTGFVHRNDEELTASCSIDVSTGDTCIANLSLPYHWWHRVNSRFVDVHYSTVMTRNGRRCPAQNLAARDLKTGGEVSGSDGMGLKKMFISQLNLAVELIKYEELREDQHVLIFVPVANFSQGSVFRVSVKIQAESTLQTFVMRVKCRNGIRVLNAELVNTSAWQLLTDIGGKQHVAIVTASVRNDVTYTKSQSVQEIFSWTFEVTDDATEDTNGRLQFSLEYELTNNRKDVYAPIQNRAAALIPIRNLNANIIVPVVKVSEVVNTALLTGQVLSWPMKVYLVTPTGRLTDVTLRSTCQSQNELALKVSVTCEMIYFDGSETSSASNVGVTVKYGLLTNVLFMRVWIPEFPLDVDLSDAKLSQVIGWRTPSSGITPSRSSRDTKLDVKDEGSVEDSLSSCKTQRFQSTIAEVYTRFVLSDVQPPSYLLHRKASFRVTNLIKQQLRAADTSIARLRDGNVVDGIKPGRTEIQVVLRSGRVVGTREVKVSSDRVNIDRLDVSVVSGLSVKVDKKVDFPGALAVLVAKTKTLHHRYQESLLDLTLRFEDGTSFPLSAIPDGDYSLTAETLNNQVVNLAPSQMAHTIALMAVSPGSGDLVRLTLGVTDACSPTKPRPLAVGFAHVDVDIDEFTQNDASYYKADIDRFDGRHEVKTDKGTLMVKLDRAALSAASDDRARIARRRNGKVKLLGSESTTVRQTGLTNLNEELAPPQIEAQKQLQSVVEVKRGTSSLEMAMYILLAVFAASVVIFTANCMVFLTRHRRKRKFTETKEPVSEVKDWVWIGRATLQRNAVDLTCPKRLMSEADFNSNAGRRPASTSLLLPPSGGSNRNSTVSTYRGSECSVRITANPLAGSDDNGNVLEEPCPSMGEVEPGRESTSSDREETACGGAKVTTAVIERVSGPGSTQWTSLSREEQLRELEEVVASGGSISNWDHEEFGMTYGELMEYFDNLKESTAGGYLGFDEHCAVTVVVCLYEYIITSMTSPSSRKQRILCVVFAVGSSSSRARLA